MSRGSTRALRDDDRAIAGAIGLVMMLAVAVTAYAHHVRTNIPVYGEESEHAWDETLAGSFRQLGRSVADGVADGSPAKVTVPRPPEPRSIRLPFLGSAAPAPPSGALRFDPDCADVTATHTLADGRAVTDLAGGPKGCLRFQAAPVYSRAFGYAYEFGGTLRTQAGRAVVVSGPALELDASSPAEYRVTLSLPGLRGASAGASTDGSSVQVDLVPGASTTEVEQEPNAASASWTFDTAYPSAWKSWFKARFDQAGFVASRAAPGAGESARDYAIACNPVDCSTPGGRGQVQVTLHGPRSNTEDLKLSITYGLVDVSLR